MGTLVDICKKLKTLVLRLRVFSFENIGNKTTTIQNSGSGDIVIGDKNVNKMNIHISPCPSVFLSAPAMKLLQQIVDKGRANSNIFLTNQKNVARIDNSYYIEFENLENYLDELSDAGMMQCLTNMRYILLREGINFCKNKN